MKSFLFALVASILLASHIEAQTLKTQGANSSSHSVGGLNSNTLPDLAITPRYRGNSGKPRTGYCGPLKNGMAQYAFYVTNIGDAASKPARVNVWAPGFAALSIGGVPTVPALPPGKKHLVQGIIPDAWVTAGTVGQANFTMEVNRDKKVSEKTLQNNLRKSKCLGGKTQSASQ